MHLEVLVFCLDRKTFATAKEHIKIYQFYSIEELDWNETKQ